MSDKRMKYYVNADEGIVVAKIKILKYEIVEEIVARIYKNKYVNQFAKGDTYRMKIMLNHLVNEFCFNNHDPRIKGHECSIIFTSKATVNQNDDFDLDFGKKLAHDRVVEKIAQYKTEVASNVVAFFSNIALAAEDNKEFYLSKILEKKSLINKTLGEK